MINNASSTHAFGLRKKPSGFKCITEMHKYLLLRTEKKELVKLL